MRLYSQCSGEKISLTLMKIISDLQELPSDYEDLELPDMGERHTDRDRSDNSSGDDDNSSSSDNDDYVDDNDEQEADEGNVNSGGNSMAAVITNIVNKG